MKITTNIDDAIKELRIFIARKDKQLEQLAEKTPRQLGTLVKNEVMRSIMNEGAVSTGDLARSISVTGLRASTQMSEATVGSSSPYAKYVEEGVRAGGRMPPVAKIYRWMIQKGLEASEAGAFLIARKIKEQGIPARRPFEKGVQKAESMIDHEMTILLNKTLTKD